jgi:hypothetical protein
MKKPRINTKQAMELLPKKVHLEFHSRDVLRLAIEGEQTIECIENSPYDKHEFTATYKLVRVAKSARRG